MLSFKNTFKVNTFLPITDQFILSLDKRTDAYKALSDRLSFVSKFGQDTPNIDDLCSAAQNLAASYSNYIDKSLLGSELVKFNNFLRLRVNKNRAR